MPKDKEQGSTAEITNATADSSTSGGVSAAESPKDVILLGGPSEDGQGVAILRMRDNRVEAGELRTAAPGKPIVGELVRLSRREESERLFDVEVLARSPYMTDSSSKPSPALPAAAALRKGPAKVASDAYRAGWEDVFGSKSSKPGAGNSDLN